MKNKKSTVSASAFDQMSDDIKVILSGGQSSWRHYLALGLALFTVGFILSGAWAIFSPASQAAVQRDRQDQVTIGHVEFEISAPSSFDEQDVLDNAQAEIDKLLSSDVAEIQEDYGDILSELEIRYKGQDLTALQPDAKSASEDLQKAVQSQLSDDEEENQITQPPKKAGFFQKIWNSVVGFWKKTFNISLVAMPAYAASSVETCFAGEKADAIYQNMLITSQRIKELKSSWPDATVDDRSDIASELSQLSGLAGKLQSAYKRVSNIVKSCEDAQTRLADRATQASDEANQVTSTLRRDQQLTNWMTRNGIDISVATNGDIVATKTSNTTSDLGSVIRPRLSATDFTAEDLQTFDRVLELLKDQGNSAELDRDLQNEVSQTQGRTGIYRSIRVPAGSYSPPSDSTTSKASPESGEEASQAEGSPVPASRGGIPRTAN